MGQTLPCSRTPTQLFVVHCVTKHWGEAWEQVVIMITTEKENKVCAIKNHVVHGIGLVFQEIDKTSSRNKISMLRHSSCFMQNSSLYAHPSALVWSLQLQTIL